jgi:integrase
VRQETHFETKAEAKTALAGWEMEIASGRYVTREQERITVAQILDAYGEELRRQGAKSPASFDANSKTLRLGPKRGGVREGGLGTLPACALTTDRVDSFRDRCIGIGLAKSTVDKAVECLRAAMTKAFKDGKLVRVPALSFFRPDNRRTGFFEQEEHEAVLKNLPPILADVAAFAHGSGWRRGEIVGLTWDRVDREKGVVRLDDSKNGDRRTLPYRNLRGFQELVERRWQARAYETKAGPAISEFVFHDRGHRLGDFRKAWRKACVAAGVGKFLKDKRGRVRYEGRLLHDYRRSAVRDLILSGVDRVVAKKISGHRTDAVFERYAIMTEDDKAAALERLEKFRADRGATPSNVTAISADAGEK